MLVENRYHRKSRDSLQSRIDLQTNKKDSSKFRVFSHKEGNVNTLSNNKGNSQDTRKIKGKGINLEDSLHKVPAQKKLSGISINAVSKEVNFDLPKKPISSRPVLPLVGPSNRTNSSSN